MNMKPAWWTLAASLLAGPMPAAAQQRRLASPSDSIPRALAEALLLPQLGFLAVVGVDPRQQTRLVVGELPAALAGHLWVPPGAKVLGGVAASGFGSAVIQSSASYDSLTAGYRRSQPSLGWSAPPARNSQALMYTGFVPAYLGTPSPQADAPLIFCSREGTLTIAIDSAAGGRRIHASVIPVRADLCESASAMSRRFASPDYPTLRNPLGSGDGWGRNCSPMNSSGGGGQTKLQTGMSIDDVFAHYGKQLSDSGWTRTSNETRGQTWSRVDSAGMYTEVTLIAERRADAPQCLEMRMNVSSRR